MSAELIDEIKNIMPPLLDGDYRAGSRLTPCQWETSLQSNGISHWLGANLESALDYLVRHKKRNVIKHFCALIGDNVMMYTFSDLKFKNKAFWRIFAQLFLLKVQLLLCPVLVIMSPGIENTWKFLESWGLFHKWLMNSLYKSCAKLSLLYFSL